MERGKTLAELAGHLGGATLLVDQSIHYTYAPDSVLANGGGKNEGVTTTRHEMADSKKNDGSAPAPRSSTPSVTAKDGGVNSTVKLYQGQGHVEADGAGSKNESVEIGTPRPEPAKVTKPWWKDPKWVVPIIAAVIAASGAIGAAYIKAQPPASAPVSAPPPPAGSPAGPAAP